MRVPERRKPKLAGFGTFLPALAVPVSITGIIVLLTEILVRLGLPGGVPSAIWGRADVRNVPRGDIWGSMLIVVDLLTAAWLTWYFHRQTATYSPLKFDGGWVKRAFTAVLWLVVKSFFFGIMALLALFMVLVVMLTQKLALSERGYATQAIGTVLIGVAAYLLYFALFNRMMFAEVRRMLRR